MMRELAIRRIERRMDRARWKYLSAQTHQEKRRHARKIVRLALARGTKEDDN